MTCVTILPPITFFVPLSEFLGINDAGAKIMVYINGESHNNWMIRPMLKNKTTVLNDNTYPQIRRLCEDFDLSISNKARGKDKSFCLYDKHKGMALSPYFDSVKSLEEYVSTNTVDILTDYLAFISGGYSESTALYA